jgi:hypothetical protein
MKTAIALSIAATTGLALSNPRAATAVESPYENAADVDLEQIASNILAASLCKGTLFNGEDVVPHLVAPSIVLGRKRAEDAFFSGIRKNYDEISANGKEVCAAFVSPNITCIKTGGVAFGSLATMNAGPAGTLSGATLNPSVVSSSLQTVGPLASLNVTRQSTISDHPRSLQSFNVDITGAIDTTAAFQTALRAGVPLTCQGTVQVTSLVTTTGVDVSLEGHGGVNGCVILLTGNQSMININGTGNALRTSNKIRIEHVKIIPQAVITSVTSAPHTAALDIEYSLGTNGTTNPDVYIHDVQVQPNADTNYILNGIYLNDVQTVHVDDFHFEGRRSGIDASSNPIVIDGTHAPTTFTIEHVLADYVGAMVLAPEVATAGFQGIRVLNSDCVSCYYGVNAAGSADGTSDYILVEGLEGAYFQAAVSLRDVGHAFIHGNYAFLVNPQTGTITNPVCYLISWDIAPPIALSPGEIYGNACDGAQASGFTGSRIGVVYGGFANVVLAGSVGVNMLSNLDLGVFTTSGTNGVLLSKQTLRNVTTEWTNAAAPGNIQPIPPLWESLTVAQLPACNALTKGQERFVSDAVAPTYNSALTGGGSVVIEALCNGSIWVSH